MSERIGRSRDGKQEFQQIGTHTPDNSATGGGSHLHPVEEAEAYGDKPREDAQADFVRARELVESWLESALTTDDVARAEAEAREVLASVGPNKAHDVYEHMPTILASEFYKEEIASAQQDTEDPGGAAARQASRFETGMPLLSEFDKYAKWAESRT